MKKIQITYLILLLSGAAIAQVMTLDKVKVQWADRLDLTNIVLEAGELVRQTNDNSLWMGDGVTPGGRAVTTSGVVYSNTFVRAVTGVPVAQFRTLTNGLALWVWKASETNWILQTKWTED